MLAIGAQRLAELIRHSRQPTDVTQKSTAVPPADKGVRGEVGVDDIVQQIEVAARRVAEQAKSQIKSATADGGSDDPTRSDDDNIAGADSADVGSRQAGIDAVNRWNLERHRLMCEHYVELASYDPSVLVPSVLVMAAQEALRRSSDGSPLTALERQAIMLSVNGLGLRTNAAMMGIETHELVDILNSAQEKLAELVVPVSHADEP
jgi:hypothetical protein